MATSSDQTWVGVIAAGGFIAIRLHMRQSARGLTAILDFTNQPPDRQAIIVDSLFFDGQRFHAEWSDAAGRAILDGVAQSARRDSVAITGTFVQGSSSGTFYLAPGSHVSREALGRWFGLYELEPGHLIWLGEVSELSRRPAFIDALTGRYGALYPAHPDTLFSGPAALLPAPVTLRAAASLRDWPTGDVRTFQWIAESKPPLTAKRLDAFTTEEVAFFNDTVRLTGTLVLPRSKGPHPAVVFIHGSGGGTRGYFSSLPFLLATKGIASLVYDKRGSGGSSGNRHISRFEALADDALAGVRLLKTRGDIDKLHVGLYGHSQGGWIAPLAASRSRGDVAFVVTVAGPAKDFEKQTNDEIRNVMREYGLAEADVQGGLDHQRLWWQVNRHEAPVSALVNANAAAQSQPWARFVFSKKLPPDTNLDPPGAYAPERILRALRVPILALYGGKDNRVLGDENAILMNDYLRAAGNKDYVVKVFPRANHDMTEVGDWAVSDALRSRTYVEGYFNYLLDWIVAHAFSEPRQ